MVYAQLNEDGTYLRQIETTGNVEWDATHFCPAYALTAAEAEYFRVVTLTETPPPLHDFITQTVERDGGELIEGQWQYKWKIVDLPADVIAANQAAEIARQRDVAKKERAKAVAAIKVTTAAGNTFDGDEDSQSRMSRAIIALNTGLAPSVNWVLADNSVIEATKEELTEALVLAGQAQAALWII